MGREPWEGLGIAPFWGSQIEDFPLREELRLLYPLGAEFEFDDLEQDGHDEEVIRIHRHLLRKRLLFESKQYRARGEREDGEGADDARVPSVEHKGEEHRPQYRGDDAEEKERQDKYVDQQECLPPVAQEHAPPRALRSLCDVRT